MEFNKEQIEKAKNCKTIEELKELAKNEGLKLTEEEAKMYFQATRGGELNDEDLDKVAGGAKGGKWEEYWSRETDEKCPFCGMVHRIKARKLKSGEDRRNEYNPNRCPCGAEIRFWDTTMNYDFVKNGEERDSIRLGR